MKINYFFIFVEECSMQQFMLWVPRSRRGREKGKGRSYSNGMEKKKKHKKKKKTNFHRRPRFLITNLVRM